MPAPRILIVGGSTRAAADSVRRIGCMPICADLFADLDLRTTAEVVPVRNYPASLPADVEQVRADGWFYCGALENHPKILEKMMAPNASYGPLLGTPPNDVRLVRDPQWLAGTLRSAGVDSLDVLDDSTPPKPDGTWIQKPLASAGGRCIRVWDDAAARIPFRESHYFQRRVAGIGMSALFQVDRGEIEFLGASNEIEANAESQPPSQFAYCGSYGPCNSWNHEQSEVPRQLRAIGKALVENAPGLNGLIGVDFRLSGDQVWLTEVNPRYTASVEVLELASGRSLFNPAAINRFRSDRPASNPGSSGHRFDLPEMNSTTLRFPPVVGKQILYAKERLVAPDLGRVLSTPDPWQIPMVADIPVPGTVVESGWPICTVLAGAEDVGAVKALLRSRASLIRDILEIRPAMASSAQDLNESPINKIRSNS